MISMTMKYSSYSIGINSLVIPLTFTFFWCAIAPLIKDVSFYLLQHWRWVCSTARWWSNLPTLSNSSQVWKEPSCPCSHCTPDPWEAPQVGWTPTVLIPPPFSPHTFEYHLQGRLAPQISLSCHNLPFFFL